MEDDEGVCFGSSALAAAAQAVLLIRWLLSQAAAACTGDQEVGAALPAAQSRATREAQHSQAPPAQPQLLSLPPTPTTTCYVCACLRIG